MSQIRLFNWAWSKYLYLDKINNILKDKNYNQVIDWFLGSWNLLLNINVKAKEFIWYDIIKLLPNIYSYIDDYNYSLSDINDIINEYDNFKDKTQYYNFRNNWNFLYKHDDYSKKFIIMTILLLKMCSNSMVRFNKKEEFNQWFRWTKDINIWFFKSSKTSENILIEINKIISKKSETQYVFKNKDLMVDLKKYNNKNTLLLLDPPYVISHWKESLYGTWDKDWNDKKEKELLDFLLNDFKGDFIYFNYLEIIYPDKTIEHKILKEFLVKHEGKYKKSLNLHPLREQVSTWQKRKGTKDAKEFIITNIF